jgi:hypothetical protein
MKEWKKAMKNNKAEVPIKLRRVLRNTREALRPKKMTAEGGKMYPKMNPYPH